MKKALKNKLENMLPDYLTGDLGKLEIEYFEREIVNFPDLQEIIQDSTAMYSRIERIDYDSIFEAKSQNLATKARLKLIERKSSKFWRFALAPMLVMLAVSIYYFANTNSQPVTTQKEIASEIGISDKFIDEYSSAYMEDAGETTDETIKIKEDITDNTDMTETFFDDIFDKLSDYPDLMYRYSGFDIFKINTEKNENNNLDNIIEEMQNDEII
ncbi:MAG: hypothetical protein WCR42_00045 [bacterium]